MKRLTFGIIAVLASLTLFSCDAFFETNLFKEAGLGQVDVPSSEELSTMSVSEIEEYTDSPDFFDELADDSSKKTAVSDNLESQYTDPEADAETVQSAAELYAEVQLKTTDAFDVVNGIFDAVSQMTDIDFDNMTSDGVTSFVEAALPAEVLADETRFKAAVVALLAADDAYDALGTSIGTDGLASGVDATSFVQAAVVAALVDGVPGATADDQAAALWDALQGTASLSSYTSPDFSTTGASGDLGNIIAASGIDLSQYGVE